MLPKIAEMGVKEQRTLSSIMNVVQDFFSTPQQGMDWMVYGCHVWFFRTRLTWGFHLNEGSALGYWMPRVQAALGDLGSKKDFDVEVLNRGLDSVVTKVAS